MSGYDANLFIATCIKDCLWYVLPTSFTIYQILTLITVTWGYAIFFWDDHFIGSGPPQRQLLRALQNFDVVACYVDTLGPQRMQEECLNTIERMVPPTRVTVLGKVVKKL